MRRRSPGVRRADELFGASLPAELTVDPDWAIGVLEPMVKEERCTRLKEVISERLQSVTVLMDAPHDPHNGAAMVRSCDAFGVQHLHVVERVEPFLVASSVARGSEKWIDVHRYRTASEAAETLQKSGYEFVATHPDGQMSPEDLGRVGRPALVVGNEREGIAADLLELCAHSVRVPMRGFTDSLNLGVCTAILLAAAVRNRPGDLEQGERRRLYARGLYLTVPRAAEVLLEARGAAPRYP